MVNSGCTRETLYYQGVLYLRVPVSHEYECIKVQVSIYKTENLVFGMHTGGICVNEIQRKQRQNNHSECYGILYHIQSIARRKKGQWGLIGSGFAIHACMCMKS